LQRCQSFRESGLSIPRPPLRGLRKSPRLLPGVRVGVIVRVDDPSNNPGVNAPVDIVEPDIGAELQRMRIRPRHKMSPAFVARNPRSQRRRNGAPQGHMPRSPGELGGNV